MEGFLLLLSILLFTWNSAGHENEEQFRLQNGDSTLINKTTPVLLHHVKEITRDKTKSTRRQIELISSRLQSVLPPFALTSETVKNRKCQRDSRQFLKHLSKMNLWALKMYDASGKLPSGLLNGNINQFGDFDQCLDVHEPKSNIRGKYCLVYFQIQPRANEFSSAELSKAFTMLQSHFLFKSKLTDSGHRVPRFSTLNWGVCIPNSCSFKNVENYIREIITNYTNGTGFTIEVKVDPEMCQENKPFRASPSFIIVSCLFVSVAMLSALATCRDIPVKVNSSRASFLHCFSLKRNVKALLSLNRSPDDIKSIHGIRTINALMLILCHKSMALFFLPYSNRTTMVEKLSQPWSIIARIASLYTDSFIMMSGLLTSYSFFKTLQKTGKLNVRNEYFNRLMRIVPPLAAIILFSTFILPELGSGPQWNLIVSQHAGKCKANWWKNLFFIHNYFGFENMCLTHTHHMGIDTQLFAFSPLLVYSLFKWPLYGLAGLVGLAVASTMARYKATVENNLSFFIFPGISVGQMMNTANYSYIVPFHRLTSYIIGILYGYALRHYRNDFKIKSSFLRIGWAIFFTFLSFVLNKANEMNRLNYFYDNKEAAVYAALAPVAWSLLVGWIIFVSQTGFGGPISKIMSSKYFLIWTRISYSAYLTQFPIFFFNVGLQKYPKQYSIFILVNVLEYLSILLASVLLTLFFDMPFVNMKKLFIQR